MAIADLSHRDASATAAPEPVKDDSKVRDVRRFEGMPWEISQASLSFAAACSIAIVYILGWHLSSYCPAIPLAHFKMPEFVSYCCHGWLFFFIFFLIGKSGACKSRAEAFAFYRRSFLGVYLMFLLTVSGFWLFRIIDAPTWQKAALLLNVPLAQDLLTLWLVNLILLFYLITPLYLIKYSVARNYALTLGMLAPLGFLKLRTHLVDIRFFQFLLLFAAAMAVSQNERWAAKIQRGPVVAVLAVLVAILACAFHFFQERALLSALLQGLAMLVSIPLFWKLGSTLSRRADFRAFRLISFCWFSLFLLHRLTFGAGILLYQPTGIVASLLYSIGVLLPLTLIAAYYFQRACNVLAVGTIFARH